MDASQLVGLVIRQIRTSNMRKRILKSRGDRMSYKSRHVMSISIPIIILSKEGGVPWHFKNVLIDRKKNVMPVGS